MPSDPRLAALPTLRNLADTMANDWHALAYDMGKGAAKYYNPERVAAVFLAQLSDLTIAASRDAVARLVAERLGLTCGAMAPDLGRFACGEHCCDGDRGRMVPCARPIWSMMGADETQMVVFADCPDPDAWGGDERRHVPGISAVTDPAEALTLIALAVLGASDAR